MSTTNFNVSVTENRMINEIKAVGYAGLPVKHFKFA